MVSFGRLYCDVSKNWAYCEITNKYHGGFAKISVRFVQKDGVQNGEILFYNQKVSSLFNDRCKDSPFFFSDTSKSVKPSKSAFPDPLCQKCMTGETLEVRSEKGSTLLTFDFWHLTFDIWHLILIWHLIWYLSFDPPPPSRWNSAGE